MTERPKISIVGAGNVGSAGAAAIAARRLGSVFLYDIIEDLAFGKAMDINHAGCFFHSDSRVTACRSFDELAGSDVVVIAAGAPRRAGMRRKDLLQENLGALQSTAADIMRFCPHAVVLVVTNPAESLIWFMKQQYPQMRVIGLGCTLDTVRFRFFLAEAAGVSADSVDGIVIGTHDDNMIPLVKHARIGSNRAEETLTSEQISEVVTDTRQAGAVIVGKLKTRGSYYAASCCVAEIVEAVVRDTRKVFPVGIVCDGQYGYHDTCLALPAAVGADGVSEIVIIDLDAEDRKALDFCASEIRKTAGAFHGFLKAVL